MYKCGCIWTAMPSLFIKRKHSKCSGTLKTSHFLFSLRYSSCKRTFPHQPFFLSLLKLIRQNNAACRVSRKPEQIILFWRKMLKNVQRDTAMTLWSSCQKCHHISNYTHVYTPCLHTCFHTYLHTMFTHIFRIMSSIGGSWTWAVTTETIIKTSTLLPSELLL